MCHKDFITIKISLEYTLLLSMSSIMPRIILLFLLLLSVGCTSIGRPLNYQQGNIIDDRAVAQLHQGMSKMQVATLMGTPVLENAFAPDRWDFVYSHYRNDKIRRQHHVTLYFTGDRLAKIEISPVVTA
jgi:outer membrane protein assembly factor BamE